MISERLESETALRFILEKAQGGRLPAVVSIAGGTCSGKTTFAGELTKVLRQAGVSTVLVPLDSYFRNRNDPKLLRDNGGVPFFDVPEAFHGQEFVAHVSALVSGVPIRLPQYDLQTNQRVRLGAVLEPARVIVAEGLFASHFLQSTSLPVFGVFIDTPIEICLQRRIARDVRCYGVSAEQVEEHFRLKVEPFWDLELARQRYCSQVVVFQERR